MPDSGKGGRAVPQAPAFEPVDRAFFTLGTLELARALLGLVLVHETPEGVTAGRIVEVEAYRGPEDRGAHSYGGRRTRRTEAMFGPPGIAYIYRIYGLYDCFDVVSAPEGKPEAILVRALEPVMGLDLMARRSGLGVVPGRPCRLTAGPGRLARALGITLAQYGMPLWQPPLYLTRAGARAVPAGEVARGPRVNIPYAGEAQAYPWRFWIRGHPCVSRG
ncbi:MAG: DNA-3-methyladenine glycosylase [Firmicutes bacterium]|nr:DNA-3-methyladenine glycosylase [Bacillota bacterium]